jgi:hypothetical protein
MSFNLHKVVPWGRSFDEYRAMFALSDTDLRATILDCGGGPSSFTAVLSGFGGQVISCDPLYEFSVAEIGKRIDETFNKVIEQTKANMDEFVWTRITSVEELVELRKSAMMDFRKDYENRDGNRYLAASLPSLPFKDKEFDIALCSHFLFLYSEYLSLDFHISSIRELCRVASEARVFPLLELGGRKSRHLYTIVSELQANSYFVDIEEVVYEFQKGGNEMLRVRQEE